MKCNITQFGQTTEIALRTDQYRNGRLAILADVVEDGDRWGNLSVNIEEAELADDEICVKNWSENAEWVAQVLQQLPSVFQDTGKVVPTGYVMAPIWKVNRKELECQ